MIYPIWYNGFCHQSLILNVQIFFFEILFLWEPNSWYNPSRQKAKLDKIPYQVVNVRSATISRHICQLALGSCFIKQQKEKVSLMLYNMSVSYSKVVCIKQDVAEAVRKKVKHNSYVFILPAFHPCRMFLSQLTTWIDILILQMTNDSYMALRLSSFKKMEPKFGNKKMESKEVQGCERNPIKCYFIHPYFQSQRRRRNILHTIQTQSPLKWFENMILFGVWWKVN